MHPPSQSFHALMNISEIGQITWRLLLTFLEAWTNRRPALRNEHELTGPNGRRLLASYKASLISPGKKHSTSPEPQSAVGGGTMVSLAAFCVAVVVSLCGNTAADKKLAYVTVVSSMYLLSRPGRSVNLCSSGCGHSVT